MRYLWRSLVCVSLSFCILFSSLFCEIAKADSTTLQSYDIIPLSVSETFNFSYRVGFYSPNSDTYTWGPFASQVSTDGFLPSNMGAGFNTTFSNNDLFALQLNFSNFGSLDNVRTLVEMFQISLYDDYGLQSQNRYYLLKNNLNIFSSSALIDWSGTLRRETDETVYHWASNATSSVPLSSPLLPATTSSNRFNLSLDAVIPQNPPNYTEWEDYNSNANGTWSVYNEKIDNIRITLVIKFNDGWILSSDSNDKLLDVLEDGDSVRLYCYLSKQICQVIGDNVTDTSGIGSAISSVQSSIATLSNNLDNSITQVKTQLTTSTNTITTKIDTMSQNIQTGLQNVITSAQQNTQNIINTVTTKVDEVKTGITEVKDSIIDLPNKIQEMLIGLVVPDENTINAKYAEFDELLSSRFGLIYQSADIIHDFADSFQTQAVMTADTGGIITMPSVTVNLAGTPYTFGGYDVDIIPNGFEFLQQALRLAISMVCTVVFVNMCKNKLEAILK